MSSDIIRFYNKALYHNIRFKNQIIINFIYNIICILNYFNYIYLFNYLFIYIFVFLFINIS